MQSRKEALDYGLAFPDTYVETPFRDTNWQLVRVKCSKKAFLWIYEKDGYVNLNVKADKEWRDYWRSAFKSVIPGWHQNKENWNTIILDGSVPDDAIKTMIKESYELVTDNPTRRINLSALVSSAFAAGVRSAISPLFKAAFSIVSLIFNSSVFPEI